MRLPLQGTALLQYRRETGTSLRPRNHTNLITVNYTRESYIPAHGDMYSTPNTNDQAKSKFYICNCTCQQHRVFKMWRISVDLIATSVTNMKVK